MHQPPFVDDELSRLGWTESLSEYQRAELVGRRLVIAKESEQQKRLNTEFVKSLTGQDSVNARHPYGRPFTFNARQVTKEIMLISISGVLTRRNECSAKMSLVNSRDDRFRHPGGHVGLRHCVFVGKLVRVRRLQI